MTYNKFARDNEFVILLTCVLNTWQIVHLVIKIFGIRLAMSYWTVNIIDVASKVVQNYEFMILQYINSIFLTKFK
jgi:lipopolysaccharide export LptBFGC system permease protein LptF